MNKEIEKKLQLALNQIDEAQPLCPSPACDILSNAGMNIDIALTKLRTVPEPTDFTKECRDLRKKGATSEQWEYATKLGEACDIIDQLNADIEQHRWIPVSERLPELNGLTYFVSNGIWIERIWFDVGWCLQDGLTPWVNKNQITHWKPIILPKLNEQAES